MVFYNLPYQAKKITLIALWMLFSIAAGAQNYQEPNEDSVAHEEEAIVADSTAVEDWVNTVLSDSAVLRSVPDSTVAGLKKNKEFAYANDPAYWVINKEEQRKGLLDGLFDLAESSWIKLLIYLLLIGLLLFALYKIIVANKLFLFYSSSRRRRQQQEGEEDLSEENLDGKIEESVKQKNYRLAVRYMYLKTLHLLDQKGLIQFNAKATNSDYVNAMSKHNAGELFKTITRHYDYTWYGEFELNEHQFSYLRERFTEFYQYAGIRE